MSEERTKDIWAEKPKRFRKQEIMGKHGRLEINEYYWKDEMDAWLEKLKAEFDRSQKEGLEHHAIAVGYYEKLEAVKKELKHHYDARYAIFADEALSNIKKILEVSQ